ncbi:MAG TPA: glycosyltransferase family 4 protein [Nitrospiraceae bacterium]|nr:glycosyltransferase family 4 protein [Nitrospiraceae bacterium]
MNSDLQKNGARCLLIFTLSRLEDVVGKGNIWYVRHYENHFDEVYVAYLFGKERSTLTQGNTTLISLAGRSRWLNLALAPLRLYRLARRLRPTIYLTADQILSWWTGLMLRWSMGAKVVLMPVSMPEQLYRDRGVSQTGMPIFLERQCLAASYRAAYKVLTAHAFGDFVNWLENEPAAKDKLIVLKTLVDALPTPSFLASLDCLKHPNQAGGLVQVIYVGRLHPEKLVDHLLRVMDVVKRKGYGDERIRLHIVGDGPHRAELEAITKSLGIVSSVIFHGSVGNSELPALLVSVDMFASTLTGTSLREAALCRLPVVAYDRDWVHGLLIHEKTALLVTPGDIEGFAGAVIRLAENPQLRQTLAENVYQLALTFWSISALKDSLVELDRALSDCSHEGSKLGASA